MSDTPQIANYRTKYVLSLVDELRGRSAYLIPTALIAVWVLVLVGTPAYLPTQIASWLTFIALLITPGYLLADMITWRMEIDRLERLALALPLGTAIMAVPGIIALLQHLTINGLTAAWIIASASVLIAWLFHKLWTRLLPRWLGRRAYQAPHVRWSVDEIILLLWLMFAFVLLVPTLSLYKIDGDAYAVSSFSADALAGLPLNATEPLFGTTLGPGVRMVFNQSLPMFYLWAHLADIHPITLTATASRSMLALWAILASYTLGRAAGANRRRFGLFTASIQLLIYVAAPFVRGDNVSLFFFERINADKFMVPVTMLPVIFAFSIRYVRDGRRDTWIAAAVCTFAVSTIHPLVAAMLALALGAFGGLHLLSSLRGIAQPHNGQLPKISNVPWLDLLYRNRVALVRSLALLGLVAIVMFLPFVQLIMAHSEAPLAASYPSSFDGWPIGKKMVPVLPFIHVPSIALYGPLPDLAQLEANQANTTANPFLIWRFAVNMNRRRLILLDIDRYMSDPSLLIEPPYLLALLLLPFLLRRIRSDVATQFALGTTLAILFVMFNPILTPLIGSLVMPWILWRFIWVLPYSLIIALVVDRLVAWLSRTFTGWLESYQVRIPRRREQQVNAYTSLAVLLATAVVLSPGIARNIANLNDRTASPYFFPTPERILARLNEVTAQAGPVTVLADQDLSVTIPAYVANANVVAHRAPTISEVFPANQQDVALQRLIDQDTFYRTSYLTRDSVEILRRYHVSYVITSSGSDIDLQLRLAPHWFNWLMDDQSYSLYGVRQLPVSTTSIQGNSALVQRQWEAAEQLYLQALEKDPRDWLALVGMAEVAHAQGRFDEALDSLKQIAAQLELPILHYRLGQLYAERGLTKLSIAEFDWAQRTAPHVTRFHIALGDACLSDGQETCAADQYEAAVANEAWADESLARIAQADLWRRRGRSDRALPLYEQAVALRPSEYNQFVLASAYREAGQFDHAKSLVRTLQLRNPLSAEVLSAAAAMMAGQNQIDDAVALYQYAIWLQDVAAQESTQTRLLLSQLLLDTNRLDEAEHEIDRTLALSPYDAAGHRLLGDLYYKHQQFEQAIQAYQRAFQLDPTQIAVYVSLSNQLRQHGGRPGEPLALLQTASQLNPGEATLLIALGDQLQRLGDLSAAVETYQSALNTLDPYVLTPQLRLRSTGQIRAFAYARLAAVYEDLGQLEPAMNYYRAVVAAAPDISWPYVLLGDALRRRNDAATAEANYRLAIQHDATHVDAYVRLADLLNAQGNTDEAEELYDQALQIALSRSGQQQQALNWRHPNAVASPARLPTPVLESGETVAPVTFRTLEQIAPPIQASPNQIQQIDEIVNAVRVLARLYQMNNQIDEAVSLYQQKLEQGSLEGWSPIILAQFHKGLGDLYMAQQKPDLAVPAYQQAVDLDNWWPEARLSLAEALTAQDDSAAALRHLQTASEIAPGAVEAQVALASALDRQGQRDEALEIYQATAKAHPGNAQATLALARAWQDRNRWEEAEEAYRTTISMNAGTTDAYVGLAELAIDQTRYSEAEALLGHAIEIDRQDVNPYIHLFELEQRRGNPDRALDWYRRAAAVPRAGQTINIALYDSLLRYGSYDIALAYVQDALKLRPQDVELLYRLAKIQQALGRYADAEATLAKARQLNPGDSRLYAELGELYRALGRPRAALTLYEQAIDLAPKEVSYYLAAGQLWAAQGDFDKALAVLKEGQIRAVRPVALYANISALQLRQGQPELALKSIERGLSDWGENAQLFLALGAYYESRGEFEKAEQEYTHALELDPYSASIHVALADLYLIQEQTAEALNHYNRAITLEPANPGHYLVLANAYQLAGRGEEATKAYNQALALAPTLVEAYLNLAVLYQEQERWDEARQVYQRGIAIVPTSGELLTQYGGFLLNRGEEEPGLALLHRAAQIAPTANTLIARAALYSSLGRTEDAVRDLQAALEKEPGSIDALLALGDLYREQDNMDAAQQEYQEIVTLTPGAAVGYLRLGALANQQGDREEAERYVEAARQADPGALIDLEGTQDSQ